MKKSIAHPVLHAFTIIASLCLPSCIHKKQIDRQKLHINHTPPQFSNHNDTPPPITIWVHGTLMFRTPQYHHIFNNQSGLVPMLSLPKNNHFRILAETIAEHDSEHFPLDEFYIFSWSGKLHNKERKDAAKKLYQDILKLAEEYYNKYGCQSIIRIIAHSHGGNVVLNMVPLSKTVSDLTITALILLACPVQGETMHLVDTPLFEHVYSLYSSFDIIQILAPQFKYTRIIDQKSMQCKNHYKILPFSARIFPRYNHVTQAKIKINDYPIAHSSFATKEFSALLPTILRKLDKWHYESIINNTFNKHKLLCIYRKKL